MIGLSIGQGILLGICIGAFLYGTRRHETARGSAVAVIFGMILVAFAIAIDFASHLVPWIPNRSLREVFLYSGAPPGDVVVPVAYACIFFGAGGLVRRMISSMTAKERY